MPNEPHAEDRFEGHVSEQRHKMPIDREGFTHKVEIHDVVTGQMQEGYITGNYNDDGKLGEMFLTGFGKSGSTLEGWVQLCATLFSIALQYGAEFEMLARKIAVTKFPPYGETDNPEIPWCNSVPDYIVRYLAKRFGTAELWQQLTEGPWQHDRRRA